MNLLMKIMPSNYHMGIATIRFPIDSNKFFEYGGHVIDCDLSLLFSLDSMKKYMLIVNEVND